MTSKLPTDASFRTRGSRPPSWLRRWLVRAAQAETRRIEAKRLAAIPDHLLYDMGLTPDGVPSLARQLRPDGDR